MTIRNKIKKLSTILSLFVIFIGLALTFKSLFGAQDKLTIEQFLVKETDSGSLGGTSLEFLIRACDRRESSISANLNYGDGIVDNFQIRCGESISKIHTYTVSGRNIITLKVRNSFGEELQRQIEVDVRNFPPVIREFSLNPLSNLSANQIVLFDIAICDSAKDIIKARLFPGDGREMVIDPSCGLSTYSVVYGVNGTYTAKVVAEDSNSQRSEKLLTVTIGSVTTPPSSAPSIPADLRRKLVRSSPTGPIYYITEVLRKRKIPNMDVFFSYGNKLSDVILVPESTLQAFPDVKLIHLDNELPFRVFLLENNTKRWITTFEVLKRLGLENEPVAPVNLTEFVSYPTGQPIY